MKEKCGTNSSSSRQGRNQDKTFFILLYLNIGRCPSSFRHPHFHSISWKERCTIYCTTVLHVFFLPLFLQVKKKLCKQVVLHSFSPEQWSSFALCALSIFALILSSVQYCTHCTCTEKVGECKLRETNLPRMLQSATVSIQLQVSYSAKKVSALLFLSLYLYARD